MNDTLFLGFYFGVLSVVLLYNLQWYFSTKEKSYLYYVLMQLFMITMFMHSTEVYRTSIIFSAYGAIIFSLYFIKEFLNLEKYFKNVSQYFLFFEIIFFIFVLVMSYTKSFQAFASIPFFVLFMPFLIFAYKIYKKGSNLAKYFLIGWGGYVFFLFLAYLSQVYSAELIRRPHFIQIGNLIEAIFLSFALSEKTNMIIKEQKQQENIMIHQSRLASMGEMLANISHQWRQPLNRIATYIINMQIHLMENYKKEIFLNEHLQKTQIQLEYMSTTIEDFSNFYKKDKQKELFLVSQTIYNTNNIVKDNFSSLGIKVNITIQNDLEISSYPKELAQVLLNLLQNSKDALLQNNIKNKSIDILLNAKELSIQDNAKGIPKAIIHRIFEPYFTTKGNAHGTGIGLYMSKMILEKNFEANIEVYNTHEGACFKILFHS